MAIIGCASAPILPAALSSPYGNPDQLAADNGIGDGIDAAYMCLRRTDDNPQPPAVSFYATPATTLGVRGALTTSGITGSAVVTRTSGTHPVGTYEPVARVADDGNDGNGGLIGSAGIVLEFSPDNGVSWLPAQALSTAFTAKMQIGGHDTGVQYDFAPATTNAAYVTLAVELRADTLAHLANVTAHDAADTSAAQVALAASSVPATVTASTAVVNLVLAALVSHMPNITAHDGPDLVAHTALAALSAATNTKTGIDLAIAVKGILNTHEGVSLVAAGAGLMGSTASIASPQTYTAASNFLSGGVSAMDAQPRRVEVVISGGGTPADMADSVTITGFDYAGNAQTETALSLTGLGTVKSTKAWKGTGLSCAFIAADGTGASFTIGYSNGVHNSADSTNTISSPDPTYGTLFTGDTWSESKTTPTQFAIADLYTAGSPATGAIPDIAASPLNFGLIAITEPVVATDIATLSAALDAMVALHPSFRPTLYVRFRDQALGESESTFLAALATFRAACSDDARIQVWAGDGMLTDAQRSFVYSRSGFPSYLARHQGMAARAGQKGERIAQSPGWTKRGPLPFFNIHDSTGAVRGHDEGNSPGALGPFAGKGGFACAYYGSWEGREGTYACVIEPVLYGTTSTVKTSMDNRVSSALERILGAIGFDNLGGADIVAGSVLDEDVCFSMAAQAQAAIQANLANEFDNWNDDNLVTVDPNVTVDGDGAVAVNWYVNDKLYGYTNAITITIANGRT
jgi:hypothetical protein